MVSSCLQFPITVQGLLKMEGKERERNPGDMSQVLLQVFGYKG